MARWLFDVWTLMFWIPVVASAALGGFAIERGLVGPLPVALWFLTALALQWYSPLLSPAWVAGMVAQTALAIYASIQVRLDA